MIGPGTGVRVYLACGPTDMRKGIGGLAALAQDVLRQKPTGGRGETLSCQISTATIVTYNCIASAWGAK